MFCHGNEEADNEYLINEGAHRGDFAPLFVSGESFHSTYTLGERIGEGGFGKVFVARHNVLGLSRAVKRIKKTEEGQNRLSAEVKALLSLDHPHVVRLIEFFDEAQYLFLIFELCEGPDLFDRLKNEPGGRLNEYDASVTLRHMLKALQACHSKYRGHYDIKPENFMYNSEDHDDLKMIDLGLSSAFDRSRKSRIKGTPEYMAPEFWNGIYGPEGDIFSCGVVLYVCLTGEQFFPSDMGPEVKKRETRVRDFMKARLQHAVETYNLSNIAVDLLTKMLRHDRHGRPTVREALHHEFTSNCYEKERLDTDMLARWPFREANAIRARISDCFRTVQTEPILKRVTRLVIAHIGPHRVAECLAFRMLDMHGYGELSIGVLEDNFERSGFPIPVDFEQLFESVDMNRDGYIGYLTFLSAVLPASQLTDTNLCLVAFGILDSNKDGFIDSSDLAAVFGRGPDSEVCRAVLAEVVGASPVDGLRIPWPRFAALLGCATNK